MKTFVYQVSHPVSRVHSSFYVGSGPCGAWGVGIGVRDLNPKGLGFGVQGVAWRGLALRLLVFWAFGLGCGLGHFLLQ